MRKLEKSEIIALALQRFSRSNFDRWFARKRAGEWKEEAGLSYCDFSRPFKSMLGEIDRDSRWQREVMAETEVECLELHELQAHYHNNSDSVVYVPHTGDDAFQYEGFFPTAGGVWLPLLHGQVMQIPKGTLHG